MERFIEVYAYDENGFCVGKTEAQHDKNGKLMMPANATQLEPLEHKEGFDVVWNAKTDNWEYQEAPVIEEPEEEVIELTYAQKRAAEYPQLGDQMDAAFKGFKFLRDSGQELPEDTEAWITQIEAVKAKYPKG